MAVLGSLAAICGDNHHPAPLLFMFSECGPNPGRYVAQPYMLVCQSSPHWLALCAD